MKMPSSRARQIAATAPVAGPSVHGFKTRVLVPVVIATAAAMLCAALGLYWAAMRSDAISVERQVRETRHAISSSLDEPALNQEAVAVWDDPVLELRKPDPDWQWFDDNIGVWLHALFGHDQVYILSPGDVPVYAMTDGAHVEPERYTAVASELQHLVETVRGRAADDNNVHERLPGRPLHSSATVRTSDKAVHATELITIYGRPAAASAMRIVPLTDKVAQAPGAESLLVSIRFL